MPGRGSRVPSDFDNHQQSISGDQPMPADERSSSRYTPRTGTGRYTSDHTSTSAASITRRTEELADSVLTGLLEDPTRFSGPPALPALRSLRHLHDRSAHPTGLMAGRHGDDEAAGNTNLTDLSLPFSFLDPSENELHASQPSSHRTPSNALYPVPRLRQSAEPSVTFDDHTDPDAMRSIWNQIAQHRSSPFEPPHANSIPQTTWPGSRPREPSFSAEDSRRAKRRKIDSDRVLPSFKGFRYGKYGQVEPGELTMEIVSCDGGLYCNESSYAYENILKNDNTVYCTKSSRCNIVLRHQGATSFSLKELVIKAPGTHCYSSPVREGMVFVSMNQDDLLTRTARYQIQYGQGRSQSRSRDHWPFTPIISIRHNEDGTIITRTQSRPRRHYSAGMEDDDDEEDRRTAQMPPEFMTESPPFNIVTECSEDESDEDGPRIPLGRRAPNRIGALPFEDDGSDDESNPFDRDEYGMDDPWVPNSRRRDTQNMTLPEATAAYNNTTQQDATRSVGAATGLMAPHAKFFIEKDKSKCTIRFDPPVSGRFILLKMWSPHRESNSNIDIQAVVAKGFAGPRYFPSVELR